MKNVRLPNVSIHRFFFSKSVYKCMQAKIPEFKFQRFLLDVEELTLLIKG